MAEATFVLKEPNGKEATLIYLLFRFNNEKIKYSTSEKIAPKYWNSEKQRVKEVRTFSEFQAINERLDTLAITVKNTYRSLINDQKIPTPFKLKEALDKSQFKSEFSKKTNLLQFVEELTTNSTRKANTIKQWRQTMRKLAEFQTVTKTEVDFDTIDLNFYDKFVRYLIGQNYTKNTIGGFIKTLKIFMNEACERKYTKNLEYRNKKFKVMEEPVEKIYLSQKELEIIYSLNLNEDKRLEKVRDLFIVACYTGLRFSDLTQVKPENIINDGTQIRIRTEKTSELVIIPIHKYIKQILLKYGGQLPPVISNQKMNKYIKELGEMAGIDETVKIAITRGGKTATDLYSKFDLITTHTARRSFSTNAFLMSVPTISIMKITGHRTESSFMKYIRISQEENANKLVNHPFFN